METNRTMPNTMEEKQDFPRKRKRWMIVKTDWARGYVKLKHVATGEKAYAALLNDRNHHLRFSYRIFLKARAAADWRKKVFKRLSKLKEARDADGN